IAPPKVARDDNNLSKGYGFISYADFDASDDAIANMHGQYLMNKEITVQYAYKKDGKGERHGDMAERALAAQAKKHGVQVQIPAMPASLVMPAGAPSAPAAMTNGFGGGPPAGIPPPAAAPPSANRTPQPPPTYNFAPYGQPPPPAGMPGYQPMPTPTPMGMNSMPPPGPPPPGMPPLCPLIITNPTPLLRQPLPAPNPTAGRRTPRASAAEYGRLRWAAECAGYGAATATTAAAAAASRTPRRSATGCCSPAYDGTAAAWIQAAGYAEWRGFSGEVR
ncbi:hypothetical protein KC334_g19724, partial [Hortaea werneckii]